MRVCAGLRHSASFRRDGAGVSLQAAFQNEHPARPAPSLPWTPATASGKGFLLALLPSSGARSAQRQEQSSDHTIAARVLQWLPTVIRTKSKLLSLACRTLKLSVLLASPAL